MEECRELLENKHVPASVKEMVANQLIPNQEAHIQGLDRLMAGAS